jgi:hypothetical protein
MVHLICGDFYSTIAWHMALESAGKTRRVSGFVIFTGRRNVMHAPYVLHTADDVQSAVEKWIEGRQADWQEPGRGDEYEMAVHVVEGPVSFLSPPLVNNPPVEGAMIYGATPFSEEENMSELRTLGNFLAVLLGQQFVEFHLDGKVAIVRHGETPKEAQ